MTDTDQVNGFQLLDLGRLDEMVGGDEEFILEILQLFLDTSEGNIQQIRTAHQTSNYSSLAIETHTLKGSSGNVGANALMHVAGRVETAARAADPDALQREMDDLAQVYALTTARIKNRLGQ